MKTLLINLSNIRKGGGYQIALNLLDNLIFFKKYDCTILLSEELENQCDFHDDFKYIIFNNNSNFLKKFLRKNILSIKYNLVFTLFGPDYILFSNNQIGGFAIPHIVYKDSPYFKLNKIHFKELFLLSIQRNIFKFFFKALVVETNDVKDRLSSMNIKSRKNIFVVSNTFHNIFNSAKAVKSYSGEGVFKFIYPTSFYPHKNLEILREVDSLITNKNIEIYTTLPNSIFIKLFDGCKNIKNFGELDPKNLLHKLSCCNGMLNISLLECFSANYIEAFKLNLVLVCSNLDFASKICKNGAIYTDPNSADDIANKLILVKSDSILRNKLISRGSYLLKSFENSFSRVDKFSKICDKYV